MGYSIMTPFETEEDKKKMKDFLDNHFRTLAEVISHLLLKGEPFKGSVPPTDDLSYMGEIKESVLGYDYGAGDTDEERDYFYSLCYWMAVHGGKRGTNGKPYIIYDGIENWTVFANEPSDRKGEWVEVNEYGYRKMSTLKQMEHFPKAAQLAFRNEKKRLEKIDEAICSELNRLSELWKQETTL